MSHNMPRKIDLTCLNFLDSESRNADSSESEYLWGPSGHDNELLFHPLLSEKRIQSQKLSKNLTKNFIS